MKNFFKKIKTYIRYKIIYALWFSKKISRNYCWADAVMWAECPDVSDLFGKADHKCYWCLVCNTAEEIKEYQSKLSGH